MVPTKSVQIVISLALAIVGASASAGTLRGVSADQSKFEARGLCSDGACIGNMDAPGISQLKNFLHKVSIYEEDDRVVQSRVGNDIGFASIGAVVPNQPLLNPLYDPKDPSKGPKMIEVDHATGVMVSPCLMLTNYHAVFGGAQSPDPKNKAAVEKFRKSYSTNVVVGPGGDVGVYDVKATPLFWASRKSKDSAGTDIAVLKLDTCVGLDERVGWMETDITKESQMLLMNFAQTGIPGDKDDEYLWTDPKCKFYGSVDNGRGLEHDCATRPGASGSPIYYLDDKGIPRLVAINAADSRPSKGSFQDLKIDADKEVIPGKFESKTSGYANLAVNLASWPEITALIEADKAQYTIKNPVLARLEGSGVTPTSAKKQVPQMSAKKSTRLGTDI